MKLIIQIILIFIACISAVIPTIKTWSYKTNLSNIAPTVNTLKNNNLFISSKNLYIEFEKNTIVKIFDNKLKVNLLKDGEKIIFNNCDNLNIEHTVDSVTFSNHDNYLICSIKDSQLNIKSNFCKEIIFITETNENNSICLGSYINNIHNIKQRVKETDLSKTSLKCILNSNINTILEGQKKKHYVVDNNSCIYKESLQSVFIIQPNDEFVQTTMFKCGSQHVHQHINSNIALANVNITCLPNDYNTLNEFNVLNIRNYGFVSIISRRLSKLLEALISYAPNYGFIFYIIINILIIFVSLSLEFRNKKISNKMAKEVQELNEQTYLSDEIKQSKHAEIEKKYSNSFIMSFINSIMQFAPSILQICNIWYVIPYCFSLQNIRMLWFTLGLPDTYILIPYLNIPAITVIMICIGLFKIVSNFNNQSKIVTTEVNNKSFMMDENMSVYMELIFLFYISRSAVNSVANVLLLIITLLLKDIIKYIGEKFEF